PFDGPNRRSSVLLHHEHGNSLYNAPRRGIQMTDAIVILSTAPDAEKAAEIARALVEDHLAACVNIVPGVRSIYRWEGKLADDAEVLCVIKTARDRFDQVCARIKALHPYSVPEIIALPVVQGFAPYLEWVRGST